MTDVLVVLADGAHAAFAAGAVAELERAGRGWRRGFGAGLGAQVAALALAGEAAEAERRWRRGAGSLLEPALAAARRDTPAGMLVLPDAHRLPGWLLERGLAEHLAPEAAGLPARLLQAGASCAVAIEDLAAGARSWQELGPLDAAGAAAALDAAARFAGGWGPRADLRWGGVAAMPALPVPAAGEGWDVVCGFPVPPAARPEGGASLFELAQRRDEAEAGRRVADWAAASGVRVVAPDAASWRLQLGREDAEIGVEYPLPTDRNAELTAVLLALGARVAAARNA